MFIQSTNNHFTISQLDKSKFQENEMKLYVRHILNTGPSLCSSVLFS